MSLNSPDSYRRFPESSTPPTVLVIGGGLAGLAAAVKLTASGYQVRLLESRPRLGGRAASVPDRELGIEIDHCQHVSMGCCQEFQNFCRLTATEHLISVEQELNFIGPNGRQHRFRNGWLPAPLHLTGSFARLSYLNWTEKISLARALLKLLRTENRTQQNFQGWLDEHQQSQQLRDYFWVPVLVSALSESLDRIDLYHARKVFVDGFLQNRLGWQIHLLTVPLGTFYEQYVARYLENSGCRIERQTGVSEILFQPSANGLRFEAVRLRDGQTRSADAAILATPYSVARRLLPEHLLELQQFQGIKHLESAPITSVHFWLDQALTPLRHAVLIDRLSQWMFNRTAILKTGSDSENSAEKNGFAYQVVISNSRGLKSFVADDQEGYSQQKLIDHVWQELTQIWPAGKNLSIRHARVLTDHQAVFSVTPGIEQQRPPQQTPLPNFLLAGDYTQTGWPATMEGAVRSGFLAAQQLTESYTNGRSTIF